MVWNRKARARLYSEDGKWPRKFGFRVVQSVLCFSAIGCGASTLVTSESSESGIRTVAVYLPAVSDKPLLHFQLRRLHKTIGRSHHHMELTMDRISYLEGQALQQWLVLPFAFFLHHCLRYYRSIHNCYT